MPENPLVISIITPTFNRGKFIEETILSIKNQEYPYIEHIVVDGGSTDETLDILKKYEGTYNLKWISEKDEGCADAMEKGFKLARGDIFCWLDSDDIYLPGTIKKVMDVFAKHENVGVVFGNMYINNETGKIIDYSKRTVFDIEALIYRGMIMSPQATFWRSNLHREVGGIDKKYLRCADYDFFIRLGLSKTKFYFLNDFLAIYRIHADQLTKSIELCRKEAKEISEKYSEKLTAQRLKWKKRKVLMKRFMYFILQGDIWYVVRFLLRKIGVLRSVVSGAV